MCRLPTVNVYHVSQTFTKKKKSKSETDGDGRGRHWVSIPHLPELTSASRMRGLHTLPGPSWEILTTNSVVCKGLSLLPVSWSGLPISETRSCVSGSFRRAEAVRLRGASPGTQGSAPATPHPGPFSWVPIRYSSRGPETQATSLLLPCPGPLLPCDQCPGLGGSWLILQEGGSPKETALRTQGPSTPFPGGTNSTLGEGRAAGTYPPPNSPMLLIPLD